MNNKLNTNTQSLQRVLGNRSLPLTNQTMWKMAKIIPEKQKMRIHQPTK
jgi:hypothetical protein